MKKTLFSLFLLIPVLTCAAMPVPGVVIDYSPASSGLYIGSPSLAVWTNGDYVASHDFFGPKSAEFVSARSVVFRSTDRGQSWRRVAEIQGAFWSTLFTYRGALYLLGTDRHHGNVVIRRSTDGGTTWTSPTNAATGLLRADGEYHCAPMPVVEYQGRLWRGMEWRNPPVAWGINYRAGVMSVPVGADLLEASAWLWGEHLPSDRAWNGGDMGAWLEGNVVPAPDGRLVEVLRVQTKGVEEKAAIVSISAEGQKAAFDPATGFFPFPGGAKKFSIRKDPKTGAYWSLASIVLERHRAENPGGIRNALALTYSENLTNWTIRSVLLYHPDVVKHGFQYVDWLFDGEDLIAACRTAHDDDQGGAHNYHDANYLTFHRWKNFRTLTMADSVAMPAQAEVRAEAVGLTLSGTGWTLQPLAEGKKAFSNRDYIWKDLPARFQGWRYTQTAGGERAEMKVVAKQAGKLYLAAGAAQARMSLTGWTALPDASFHYTDKGLSEMNVYTRDINAGEIIALPQGNWTGGLLLVPKE
jgi:hypothetical protein